MSDDVKKIAEEQAKEAYGLFLKFLKFFSYACVAGLLFVASCNFGVDGTGGKSNPDPELFEEYKSNMGLE
jgi:hypothetical protein